MFWKITHLMITGGLLLSAQEDSGPRLTAREIFYGAKPAAPASAPAAPVAAAKKVSSKAPVKRTEAAVNRPVEKTPESLPLRQASETVSESGGLAMRWTITQLMPDGKKQEVPTTKAFQSGDKINVRVEVNDFGYLYILARGSSGKWSPLFPSPSVSGGDNRVGPGVPYTIPNGYVFTFDSQPGQERIFIVFSRKPEPDMDGLIYKVAPERQPNRPASPEGPRPNGAILMAANMTIGDPLVDRMSKMYARDLIVEKVEGEVKTSSIGPRFEFAAYVASKRSDDPRVTAEVTLVHK
jgi:hypothetical protein